MFIVQIKLNKTRVWWIDWIVQYVHLVGIMFPTVLYVVVHTIERDSTRMESRPCRYVSVWGKTYLKMRLVGETSAILWECLACLTVCDHTQTCTHTHTHISVWTSTGPIRILCRCTPTTTTRHQIPNVGDRLDGSQWQWSPNTVNVHGVVE